MAKQMQILLAGVVVLVPIAATVWVVMAIADSVDALGNALVRAVNDKLTLPPYVGIAVVLGLVYLVGLLARTWVLAGLLRATDRVLSRLPGIRTIYESVRDLLKLFGGDAGHMGRTVLYRQPGTDAMVLGIMTNEHPLGVDDNVTEHRVAVYQPFAYMFGGPVIYVPIEHVTVIDMPVERALKLCATAHVGAMAASRGRETTKSS